jgi:hypothetical protein
VSGRAKAVLTAAVALAGAGVGVYGLLRPGAGPGSASIPAASPPRFVSGQTALPPPPSVPVEKQADDLMAAWRGAILAHDADTVLLCDRTFLGDPRTFTPALVESARRDGDDRVRAFSTRVLGKLTDATLIDVFRTLLEDRSPYVRENAAWGLGQLEARAQSAAADLEKVRKRDRAGDVRRAAEEALQRVRGGGKRGNG